MRDAPPSSGSSPRPSPTRASSPPTGATTPRSPWPARTGPTATWYLCDRVVVPAADLEIGGAAYYRDEYVKTDGRWLIDHTGYERVFEERRVHSTGALVSFRSRF